MDRSLNYNTKSLKELKKIKNSLIDKLKDVQERNRKLLAGYKKKFEKENDPNSPFTENLFNYDRSSYMEEVSLKREINKVDKILFLKIDIQKCVIYL